MGAPPVRAGALQLSTISDPVHSTRAMEEGAEGTSGGSTEVGEKRMAVVKEARMTEVEQRRKGVESHNDE